MTLTVSAPGKVVLLGEYAVLCGAPALVMAVNRRAVVRISPATDGWRIAAPDVGVPEARFGFTSGGRPKWPDLDAPGRASLALVDHILHQAARAGFLPGDRTFAAALDTSEFFLRESGAPDAKLGPKLGLGSSAALTVALASALAVRAGARPLSDRGAWLARLSDWHRGFQGGRGSGLDVAASLYGGVIEFERTAAGPAARPSAVPAGVHVLFVWSGRSASTPQRLEGFDAWRRRDPVGSGRLLGTLTAIAREGAAASGDAAAWLQVVDAYAGALQNLDKACKIHIFSEAHRRIGTLVRGCGAVYKPCGAGGGDLGLAAAAGPEALDRVRRKLQAAGIRTLDLAPDPAGLEIRGE